MSTFVELAPVVVEGAVDYFAGRPKRANPYNPVSAAHAWSAWALGWDEGRAQLEDRGQREAARWLSEAA